MQISKLLSEEDEALLEEELENENKHLLPREDNRGFELI